MHFLVAQAHERLAHGDGEGAMALAISAASAGNAEAFLTLATWRLIGDPIPRDFGEGRALLARAVQMGSQPAAFMEIALTANGGGCPANWLLALDKLRALAHSGSETAQLHLALLDVMQLDREGKSEFPVSGIRLSEDGRIVSFPSLLTPRECDHLAMVTSSRLQPALVVDPSSGRQIPHPIRTSDSALIGPMQEDLVVRAINLRLAKASNTLVEQGEALTILRYAPKQQFKLHLDAIGRTQNERIITILIYLNDSFHGGETTFPHYGLRLKPRQGDAVLFLNTLPDGSADLAMQHAGEPVRTGVKWLATRWIRARPFNQWTGPEVP